MNPLRRENIGGLFVLSLAVGFTVFVLGSTRRGPTVDTDTGAKAEGAEYTVVMENDLSEPVTLTVWATFGAADSRKRALGIIAAGATTTFTLPSGEDTYSFEARAQRPNGEGFHTSYMNEQRLIDRNFHVKLLADDMQMDAIPRTMVPPAPTYEPIELPTPIFSPYP